MAEPTQRPGTLNLAFLERLYADFLADPQLVPAEYRDYFQQLAQADHARPAATGSAALGTPAPAGPVVPIAQRFALGPRFQPRSIFNPDGQGPAAPLAGLSAVGQADLARQQCVDQLVRNYRVRGHIIAQTNPLGLARPDPEELQLAGCGLTEADLDRTFAVELAGRVEFRKLRDIVQRLRDTYCRSIGVQFMHIDAGSERRWLIDRVEGAHQVKLSREQQVRIFTRLTDAEALEEFIHKKYVGAKSFSLQGAETLIPLLDLAIDKAAGQGVDEIVLGMAHRGRLNVLANIIGKSPRAIFREFEDLDSELYLRGGDVKYHQGYSGDWTTADGRKVHLSLCFNPSHIEFINPVAVGRVRAKQDRAGDRLRTRKLALLIHGDAGFAGEGIVQETLNLSGLAAYRVGGTVHVMIDNQIGFTTSPAQGRSTPYASDVARMLQAPIFHVNGEDPEAVAEVVRLAMDFRQAFARDVFIEMVCYRRYGHNESDEPRFTQPMLYRLIDQHRSVRDAYLGRLLAMGQLSAEEAERIAADRRHRLEQELAEATSKDYRLWWPNWETSIWRDYVGGPEKLEYDVPTAVPREELAQLLEKLSQVPVDGEHRGDAAKERGGEGEPKSSFSRDPEPRSGAGERVGAASDVQIAAAKEITGDEAIPPAFHPHRTVQRLLAARREMAEGKRPIDWSAAEALALATLSAAGHRIRLTGQDTERGTFSQRHAVLHDIEDGHTYMPLAHLSGEVSRVVHGPGSVPGGSAPVEIINSPLSEAGALGYEYGYSLDCPEGLVLWEAQFGDFANAAQVIIDQFIASAQDKWCRLSGLVLLLPHGVEGAGPEHSSARLERFLQLAADDNIQVIYPTTPAQYFHVLRRQVLRKWRKPMVILTPKGLLRNPASVSSLDELADGSAPLAFSQAREFQRVIPDAMHADEASRKEVSRLILCTGKLYFELDQRRQKLGRSDVAIVRVEQLYPLPTAALVAALVGYPAGMPARWVQEEPANQGAWSFLWTQYGPKLLGRFPLRLVARPAMTIPSSGAASSHALGQDRLLTEAFEGN